MEKGAKITALVFFLAAAPAAADVIYLPCDLPLARVAPVVHFKAHIHHRHKHPVGKRGRLGLHFAIARGMCPVFVGDLLPLPEDLGGPAGEEPFGGDWLPVEAASSDFGGEGFGSFGGFGGGDVGGGGDVAPFLFEDAPSIVVEATPIPDVIGGGGDTTPSAPVPEPSTLLLILAGFAAIVLRKRRACLP